MSSQCSDDKLDRFLRVREIILAKAQAYYAPENSCFTNNAFTKLLHLKLILTIKPLNKLVFKG